MACPLVPHWLTATAVILLTAPVTASILEWMERIDRGETNPLSVQGIRPRLASALGIALAGSATCARYVANVLAGSSNALLVAAEVFDETTELEDEDGVAEQKESEEIDDWSAFIATCTEEQIDLYLAEGRELSPTALHWAVIHARAELIRHLLRRGVVCDHRDKNGDTPLDVAYLRGHADCVAAFDRAEYLEDGAWTPLHEAACSGNVVAVRDLIASGASCHACAPNGWTPLHVAVAHDQYACVDALLNAGASVNATDIIRWTPLHVAVSRGHDRVLARVLAADACDVEAKTENGWTPLHVAAANGHVSCVRALLAHGAASNVSDPIHNETPEDLAIRYRWENCVGVFSQ